MNVQSGSPECVCRLLSAVCVYVCLASPSLHAQNEGIKSKRGRERARVSICYNLLFDDVASNLILPSFAGLAALRSGHSSLHQHPECQL